MEINLYDVVEKGIKALLDEGKAKKVNGFEGSISIKVSERVTEPTLISVGSYSTVRYGLVHETVVVIPPSHYVVHSGAWRIYFAPEWAVEFFQGNAYDLSLVRIFKGDLSEVVSHYLAEKKRMEELLE